MTRRLLKKAGSTDTVAQPQPGDVLGGKYRIERVLGSGGMGVVFEVTHLVMTKNRFAVKWLLPHDDGEAGARRFRREAQISGAIRHPHVVEVYDVNFDESGSYMVMELLEGESLGGRIVRAGALPPADACSILLRCLSAVGAAHAAGVIHRDLKPANIFLCVEGASGTVHPKVLDFGISRVISVPEGDTTQTREAIIGTPAYMAPEQLRAQPCDARTDVYALGVTLYEMLSGQRAFQAEDDVSLVVKIVTGEVQPLSELSADVLPGLSQIVMKAMDRDAALRYASADEFAEALRPFANAASPDVAARVPAERPRLRSLTARGWWTAAVLVLAVAAALFAWRTVEAPEAAQLPRDSVEEAPAETKAQAASAPMPSEAAPSAKAVGSAARDRDTAPESTVSSPSARTEQLEPPLDSRPPERPRASGRSESSPTSGRTPRGVNQRDAASAPRRSTDRENALDPSQKRESSERRPSQAPSRPKPAPKLDSL